MLSSMALGSFMPRNYRRMDVDAIGSLRTKTPRVKTNLDPQAHGSSSIIRSSDAAHLTVSRYPQALPPRNSPRKHLRQREYSIDAKSALLNRF